MKLLVKHQKKSITLKTFQVCQKTLNLIILAKETCNLKVFILNLNLNKTVKKKLELQTVLT